MVIEVDLHYQVSFLVFRPQKLEHHQVTLVLALVELLVHLLIHLVAALDLGVVVFDRVYQNFFFAG
jgi:hypothetical protein